jgi:hypothetical protein
MADRTAGAVGPQHKSSFDAFIQREARPARPPSGACHGWEMLVSSSVSISAFVVESSTRVSPSTTTVPVATASLRWPTNWPVNPGNVVVLLVVSIGQARLQGTPFATGD